MFRYLKGTTNCGLCFKKDDNSDLGLIVHSDADWASEVRDSRSTVPLGMCVRVRVALSFHGRVENNLLLHCLPVRQNAWP